MAGRLVIKDYCFPGQMRLRLASTRSRYIQFFNSEYALLRPSPGSEDPDLLMIIDGKESREGGDLLHFRERVLNLLTVKASLQLTEQGGLTAYIHRPWLDRVCLSLTAPLLQSQIIEPLLYYEYLSRGYLLLHAAGVADGRHGYLFPAPGGTGKTTTCLLLVHHGWIFLGDDLILVSPEGRVYALPKPLHLFHHLRERLGFLRLSRRQRWSLLARNLSRQVLSRLLGQRLYLAMRADIRDLLPNCQIGDHYPLRKMILLNNRGSCGKIDHHLPRVREQLIDRLSEASELNKAPLLRLLPQGGELVEWERTALENMLKRVEEVYEYDINRGRGVTTLLRILGQ